MAAALRERNGIKDFRGAKVIGLISDTHIPVRSRQIPDRVFEIFRNVDIIIHAGDFVEIEVFRALEAIAPVIAVYGNMDPVNVRANFFEIDSVRCLNWNIGVVHNTGMLSGLRGAEKIAKENGFNVLVFGHTHRSLIERKEGVLYVNPGSPTIPLPPVMVKPSVGILIVTPHSVEAEIIGV